MARVLLADDDAPLLDLLARRPGVVLSRAQLLAVARDEGSVVVERIVDTT